MCKCVDEGIWGKSDAVILEGFFNAKMLRLESCVCKWGLDITISTNASLCVLPWCAKEDMQCIALDSQGPHTLVVAHKRSSAEWPANATQISVCHGKPSSAERPACQPRARPVSLIDRALAPEPPSPPPLQLRPATPVHQLLADLEEGSQGEDGSCLLHHIEQFSFFGEFCFRALATTGRLAIRLDVQLQFR